ncbi:putative metal-binding motif-containing protein [Candidatus Woesearchaeota archaeon]|nr:putative metal-binding motif-containing protein [Candidatus Woesearchaeota archaeon]
MSFKRFLLAAALAVSIYGCSPKEEEFISPPDSWADSQIPDTSSGFSPVADTFYSQKDEGDPFLCDNGTKPKTWLVDRDGDGYYDKSTVACTRPDDGLEYLTSEELQQKTGKKIPLLDCENHDDDPEIHPFYPADICDGKDNDCDGLTDEDEQSIVNSCTGGPLDLCEGVKFSYCNDGKLVDENECKILTSEETCNGTDDDCNGKIDDIIIAACEEGCSSGLEQCVNGKTECSITFTDPLCCEVKGEKIIEGSCDTTNYRFLIDGSASTEEKTAIVKEGIKAFADAHQAGNYQGLLGFTLFRFEVEVSKMWTNDYAQFKQDIDDYENVGSPEGHLIALYYMGTGFTDFPGWPTEGKRHVVMLSDSDYLTASAPSSYDVPYEVKDAQTVLIAHDIYLTVIQIPGETNWNTAEKAYQELLYENMIVQSPNLLQYDQSQLLQAPTDALIKETILDLLEQEATYGKVCQEVNGKGQWNGYDQCEK